MKFDLSSVYSLYIAISFELPDISAKFINLTEVKNLGDYYAPASDISH